MTNIFLQGLSADEFTKLVETTIVSVLKDNKIGETKEDTDLLTREEAAKYLSIDLSTLHNWVIKRKLKCYSLGARRYFKKSEIIEAMIVLEPNK
ncbi:MAG: helix-turn-helix domain-containing protein [Flavobacteriaceae bacterium]|jgi:excisionase family DNA binding protein|nr:helix-turn-helix domain-containing protein [Flavobacteriaceae bacterium]